MAYVSGFKHDIFISYAHVDNLPLTADDKGWVADFHEKLEVLLARLLGRREIFSVWRDPKLHGNDEWKDTIDAACRDSAVGVFILSPGFVASDWCRRELDALATAEKARGHTPPTSSRLFKVRRFPIPDWEEPERLRAVNGYPFYAIDPITRHEELFRRTIESDPDQRYWDSLGDLARDLAEMLKQMRLLAEGAAAPPAPAGPVVFLAEVTDDLMEERENVRRSLVQRGVRVLPESPLPAATADLLSRLREDMAQALLSVILIGSSYGRRPVGEERSFTHVQYDEAAEADKPRLLWVPRDVDPRTVSEVEQSNLLAALESEPDSDHPVELLKTGLEELKDLLLSRLFPPAERSPEPPATLVYISCPPEDDARAYDLSKALFSAQHDIVLPARNKEAAELERHHLANLRYCDALLVLYASASVLWVREELIRAHRIRAEERPGARFVMSVYESPPPPEKEEIGLVFHNLLVLRRQDGVDSERLRPLLDSLRETQA
jgi:hypothetical protein